MFPPLILAVALAAPLLLAACDDASPIDAATANAQERVAVCHYDADASTFALITVGAPAVPAHMAHGDGLPGGPVPNQPGYTFDDACVPQPDITPCEAAGGTEVGGACWFLGALGQSCDAVCGGEGLAYDAATAAYAGSGGTDGQCEEVLTALDAPVPNLPFQSTTGPLGCGVRTGGGLTAWFRMTSSTTSSGFGANIRRACACE